MTGANALSFLEMCGHFGEVPLLSSSIESIRDVVMSSNARPSMAIHPDPWQGSATGKPHPVQPAVSLSANAPPAAPLGTASGGGQISLISL